MLGMSGYTKLFASILASTIWREDNDTRIVWITMLAMSDKDGIVEASVPGLADLARVSVDGARRAILKLSSPDPDSRSEEAEGRRIESIEGGWRLINHAKYRRKMSEEERREYKRQKAEQYRKRAAGVDSRGQTETNVDSRGQTWNEIDKVDTVQKQIQKQSTDTDVRTLPDGRESSDDDPDFRPRVLQELWNRLTTPPIPKCLALGKARKLKTTARLVEHGPGWWETVIVRIQLSDFCRGQNDRGWVASFDWLIANDDNAVKVLEGKYDNRLVPSRTRTSGNEAALDEALSAMRRTP